MTQIPSDIPASAAQVGIQSHEVAKERDARRAGQAETAKRQIKTIDEAGSTVDTEDADVAIFAEAEGTGSEGREEPEERAEEPKEGGTPSKGISKDADGRFHVDLEA